MSERTLDVEIVDPALKGSTWISKGLYGPYKVESDHFTIPESAIAAFSGKSAFTVAIPEGFFDDAVELPEEDAQKPVAAVSRKAAKKLETEEYDESLDEYREAIDESKVMAHIERTNKE